MKPALRWQFLSLLLVPFLLACVIGGTGTPKTDPTPGAALEPTLPPYTFSSPENGVQVPYPPSWSNQDDPDGNALTLFFPPDDSLTSKLYVFPLESGEELESVAAGLYAEVMGGQEAAVLEDQAISLDSGTPAWWTLATLIVENGVELKVNLTTAVYGPRVYFLLTFGPVDSYDRHAGDVQALAYGMQFTAPVVSGVQRDQALYLAGGESTNPRDYDPATTHGSGDKLAFSGLVSLDPQLNLVPELAESWDVSAQGTVYTFHLRQNAVFHDGRPVTAADVVYSWERAADPATASDTVLTYLGDIVGVPERHAGEADVIAGLQVLDEHTLQVTIDAAKPYFLLKLTYPTAFVLDRANVESGVEWYRTPNGTGPYRLTEWVRFERMLYRANPDFYLGEPAIPTIVIQLYSGVGIRLYESGEIDITGVYSYDVPRVSDPAEPLHAELYSGVDLCTSYVVFDVSQPPFDDARVRQAFVMAFDRQKYLEVVMNGVGLPAHGLYPPALPGYSLDLAGLPYDPQQARQLLADSSYGGADGLPPIVYTSAGIGNTSHADIAAMAQMWQQNLGVEITIENLEPNRYYDLLYSGQHGQIFDGGWCADYPDPENFADVLFHTGAQQNLGNYSNPALDALLDEARTEQDVTRRIALYQQAERILVEDAAALFTTHSLSYILVKPYVRGYVLTPIDIPLERYLWLEP
jgi:oligopeptide transport system substrate-binding protein